MGSGYGVWLWGLWGQAVGSDCGVRLWGGAVGPIAGWGYGVRLWYRVGGSGCEVELWRRAVGLAGGLAMGSVWGVWLLGRAGDRAWFKWCCLAWGSGWGVELCGHAGGQVV